MSAPYDFGGRSKRTLNAKLVIVKLSLADLEQKLRHWRSEATGKTKSAKEFP